MSTVDVKPSSNRKPVGKAEAANEPFKQALASCTGLSRVSLAWKSLFPPTNPRSSQRLQGRQSAASRAAA